MIPKHLGHLERHSLMLILASLLGHIGNYAYHFITGRFLSEVEYGLLMALFGAVNILLFPLAAFDLSLTRTIAELQKDHQESAIASLLRSWCFRLTGLVIVALVSAMVVRPFLLNFFSTENWIPLLLALLIPCLCLFLTLSGATLRGLQCFHGLAFRNGLMFLTRAGLFGSFFALGSISTSPEQLGWLRGVGIGMAFLGPVYVILQYEMAQRRHNRLIPICVLALAYIGSVWIRQSGPDTLIRFLIIASALSLVTAVRALGRERVSPSDLSLSEAE